MFGVGDRMQATEEVYSEPFSVTRRLEALGLKLDALLDSVLAGAQKRRACTKLHPPMFPGLAQWAETTHRLRERHIPEGWAPTDDSNYSLIVSRNGKTAIAVASGDENTGLVEGCPATSSPKGPHTMSAVAAHQLALDLEIPPELEAILEAFSVDPNRETWLLLTHWSERDGLVEVRAELSLPLAIAENQKVIGWRERIILPSTSLGPTDIEFPKHTPDLDIDVRKRA